jgi:serine/threonine kinase 16
MPVLMDFGSMAPAERQVKNRIEALILQDEAAQFSTVPYRAPELFDVASDASIDARTDVWSLGCLLYALAFGYSPFECEFSNGRSRVRRMR